MTLPSDSGGQREAQRAAGNHFAEVPRPQPARQSTARVSTSLSANSYFPAEARSFCAYHVALSKVHSDIVICRRSGALGLPSNYCLLRDHAHDRTVSSLLGAGSRQLLHKEATGAQWTQHTYSFGCRGAPHRPWCGGRRLFALVATDQYQPLQDLHDQRGKSTCE